MKPKTFSSARQAKEISCIHVEGCLAGERKHWPSALIDEHKPVPSLT